MEEVLRGAFDRGGLYCSCRPLAAKSWPLTALLLTHEGTNTDAVFMRSTEAASLSIGKMHRFFVQARQVSSFGNLLRSFNRTWGSKLAARSSSVRINSGNIFTDRYEPPSAERAQKAVDELFSRTARIRAHQNSDSSRLSLAILEYAILLTIHPLSDGNGRLSRLFFAARASSVPDASPGLSLALAKLHRNRGRTFHIAMQGLRMGSPEMLLQEFESCARAIEVEHSETLEEIDYLLEHSDISDEVLAKLERLREWMSRELRML